MPKTIYRPEYEVLRSMLRDMRLNAGVTQVEMSRAMGRTQSFISDVERGARRVDVLELRDMCLVLGRKFPTFARAWEQQLEVPGSRRTSRNSKGRNTKRRSESPR